jgi:hypothetical protein
MDFEIVLSETENIASILSLFSAKQKTLRTVGISSLTELLHSS